MDRFGPWDWIAVAAYLVVSLAIGVLFARRGSRSLTDFFCSGRAAPWWLLGVSMVATTFAADTPLAVTGIVAKNGVAGNWLWWNFLMSGMLTTFLFARLWRRSEVLTDVELAELRYGGTPAKALRAFRALYLAFPINCVVMGWVTVGMFKVVCVTLDCSDAEAWRAIYLLYGVTCIYVMLSGLWGVLVTDFVQFGVAMGGSIMLAAYALDAVGGMDGLKARLVAQYGPESGHALLRMLPSLNSAGGIGSYALMTFLVMIAVQWWAAWYPGAEPGGGGYIAQRMFSAKNERHSLLAVLFFNLAHYALRPWPWIIVALCSLVLCPGLTNDAGQADPERGYPMVMVKLLPPGLLGLMLVAFLAAFMSTIATQVNWGASYVVNDVYKRFLAPHAEQRHYVVVSRLVTVVTILLGIVVSRQFASVKGAWEFILALGAGTGLVLILRWYWWRINAWSEITAMVGSLALATTLNFVNRYWPVALPDGTTAPRFDFAETMLIVVGGTTVVWLAVTFLTRPESEDTLASFYRRVRPGGAGWRPVRALAPDVVPDRGLWGDAACVVLGVVLVYGALFGVGRLIFGQTASGLALLAVALVAGAIIAGLLSRPPRHIA
jgi:SSS family solute:Na+ symporter